MDSDFLDPGKQAITGGTLGPKSGSLKIGVGNYKFERRLIAERTRDGMNAARAKDSKPGHPALDQEKLAPGVPSPTLVSTTLASGKRAVISSVPPRAST